MQHVSHRRSDEIHQLRAEIDRLRAEVELWRTRFGEALRCCPPADQARIRNPILLEALHADQQDTSK